MFLTIVLSLCIALLGAFVFLVTDKKVSKLGVVAFGCGLLVFLLNVQGMVNVSVVTTHTTETHR